MATVAIRIVDNNHNYLEEFYRDFLKHSSRINIDTLKITVCPSIGKCFKQKVDKTLRSELTNIQKKIMIITEVG